MNAIANLRVQVAIARKEKPSSLIAIQFRFIRRYFPFMRFIKLGSKLFDDEDISINIILASLYRIESIFETVEMLQHRRRQSDDEIFKPSNVNLSFIAEHIEVAITEIHQASMSSAERDKLVEYLEEALSELSKDTPAWKKIVGALVIAATLLSGMAVAPTAYENVNKALQHILGTSIEHQMPTFPTLPRHEEGNESTDDEAGPGISI